MLLPGLLQAWAAMPNTAGRIPALITESSGGFRCSSTRTSSAYGNHSQGRGDRDRTTAAGPKPGLHSRETEPRSPLICRRKPSLPADTQEAMAVPRGDRNPHSQSAFTPKCHAPTLEGTKTYEISLASGRTKAAGPCRLVPSLREQCSAVPPARLR